MRLPDTVPGRKQRFLASLELADLTVTQWCELHDISPAHLYAVLNESRVPGAGLNAAIDATIAKYLGEEAA